MDNAEDKISTRHLKIMAKQLTKDHEFKIKCTYMDPIFFDAIRGITYKRAELTRWEKIKIYFLFMKEPPVIKIEPVMLCDILPKVEITKGSYRRSS